MASGPQLNFQLDHVSWWSRHGVHPSSEVVISHVIYICFFRVLLLKYSSQPITVRLELYLHYNIRVLPAVKGIDHTAPVQYSMVQYNIVQYSTVQYSIVQYSTV